MESNENRNYNCSCNNNMSSNMNNNMDLAALNNMLNMNNENECQENNCCPMERRKEILKQIKCYDFAIQELTLYLDTHPDDEKAICLHNNYAKELRILTDKYQKMYGPLTSQFPCNKWRWIEEPWPWEGGIN